MSDSSANPAVRYALDALKVNKLYHETVEMRNSLEYLYESVVDLRANKRTLESTLVDIEMEVASQEAGKHPSMSAAAMKEHFKVALHKDPSITEVRKAIASAVSQLDRLDYDIRLKETDIKIAVARINELQGFLIYLAAIKSAEKSN